MTAYREILTTINSLKEKEFLLSKEDILSILKATKSITKHEQIIDSLIFYFKTLDSIIQNKTIYLTKREL